MLRTKIKKSCIHPLSPLKPAPGISLSVIGISHVQDPLAFNFSKFFLLLHVGNYVSELFQGKHTDISLFYLSEHMLCCFFILLLQYSFSRSLHYVHRICESEKIMIRVKFPMPSHSINAYCCYILFVCVKPWYHSETEKATLYMQLISEMQKHLKRNKKRFGTV